MDAIHICSLYIRVLYDLRRFLCWIVYECWLMNDDDHVLNDVNVMILRLHRSTINILCYIEKIVPVLLIEYGNNNDYSLGLDSALNILTKTMRREFC